MDQADALKQCLNVRSANLVKPGPTWTTQTNPVSKSITISVDPVDNGYIITGFKNGNSVRRIASSENLMDEIQGVFATLKLEE